MSAYRRSSRSQRSIKASRRSQPSWTTIRSRDASIPGGMTSSRRIRMPRGMSATRARQGASSSGRSPYGCDDMAGNVWEWTRSLWGTDWRKPEFGYPYDANHPKREGLDAGDEVLRVVRGGSWYYPRRRRALCLPQRGSTRRPGPRPGVSGGVAFCPCFLALVSGPSVLWHSGSPPSGGGAGEPSPAARSALVPKLCLGTWSWKLCFPMRPTAPADIEDSPRSNRHQKRPTTPCPAAATAFSATMPRTS